MKKDIQDYVESLTAKDLESGLWAIIRALDGINTDDSHHLYAARAVTEKLIGFIKNKQIKINVRVEVRDE